MLRQQSSCWGSKGRGRNNINLRENVRRLEVKFLEIVEFSTGFATISEKSKRIVFFLPSL